MFISVNEGPLRLFRGSAKHVVVRPTFVNCGWSEQFVISSILSVYQLQMFI